MGRHHSQQDIENMTLYYALVISGCCLCPEEMPRKLSKEEAKLYGMRSVAEEE